MGFLCHDAHAYQNLKNRFGKQVSNSGFHIDLDTNVYGYILNTFSDGEFKLIRNCY